MGLRLGNLTIEEDSREILAILQNYRSNIKGQMNLTWEVRE